MSSNSTYPESAVTHSHPSTRIIAHRGACGYLPEHTLAAKALAYGLGADFLEQDLVATRDGELVVLHDTVLDEISDVGSKFPDRRRPDGQFYVIDFTLSELSSLALNERRNPETGAQAYPGRFPYALDVFRIVPFEDEIDLVAGLNRATGRNVGIYPEIKEPAWHRAAGIDITRLVLTALGKARKRFDGPVFLQSFDTETLRGIHRDRGDEWPLVQLVDSAAARHLERSPAELAAIARYAAGLGLPYATLLAASDDGAVRVTPFAHAIKDAGLLIHPYTLRRDVPPLKGISYEAALKALIGDLRVDAVFCDFPDDGVRVRADSGA
jgi:glycerophosphoryl diester phosphodiesterase